MRRGLVLTVAVALMMALAAPATAKGEGATQISGIGFPAGEGECTEMAADYKLVMTGDLVGCVYGVVTSFHGPGPSGVYKERADETFIGYYNGNHGSFEMTENFHAKFDLDSGNEIFGFCKHPIKANSGGGFFEDVSGRLDFKDEVDDPENVFFPYKGHLKLG